MNTTKDARASRADPEEIKQSEIEALVSEIEDALSQEVNESISI